MKEQFDRLNKNLDGIVEDIKHEWQEERLLGYRTTVDSLEKRYETYTTVTTAITLKDFKNGNHVPLRSFNH